MKPIITCSMFFLLCAINNGHGALRKVSTPADFQSALDSASPGDTIQLAPAVFMGSFIASKDGPITITGDVNSTIVSDGDAGLTIRGNKWTVKSLKITEPNIAVLIEGNQNSIESVVIQKVGQGILVKGQGNTMKSVVISEAEGGIVIESDGNSLYYNSINIQAPSIILGEGTCCGTLNGNVANGRMDVKGSRYNFTNNVANHGMYVSGCDNNFMGNVANGASFPKDCASNDLGGNVYRGLGPNDTDPPQPGQQNQGQGSQGQGQGQGPQGQGQGQQSQGQYNPGASSSGSYSPGQQFPANVMGSSGSKPSCTCTCV